MIWNWMGGQKVQAPSMPLETTPNCLPLPLAAIIKYGNHLIGIPTKRNPGGLMSIIDDVSCASGGQAGTFLLVATACQH